MIAEVAASNLARGNDCHRGGEAEGNAKQKFGKQKHWGEGKIARHSGREVAEARWLGY
jgi:hypothetical protein